MDHIESINSYIYDHLKNSWQPEHEKIDVLKEALLYSACNGGKRFRPNLSLLTAQTLGKSHDFIVPYATAVEMIHTYSLIHDDLPCMDDDDIRRGQPTSHKKFGESTALLTGDALLTEAFLVISRNYTAVADRAIKAISLLALKSGKEGMIAGQMIDIFADLENIDQIFQLHQLKTGALISAAVEGAALLCDADKEQSEALSEFAKYFGMAFQVSDDILDYEEASPEKQNIVTVLGKEKAMQIFEQISNDGIKALEVFGQEADGLRNLVLKNLTRTF